MAYDPNDPTGRRQRAGAPAIAAGVPGAVPGVTPPNAVNGTAFAVPVQNAVAAAPVQAPDVTQQRSAPAIAQDAASQINSTALNAIGRNNNTTGPGSNDAETLRRIEIAGSEPNGSPSARAAMMGALSGQLTANRGITADATHEQGGVYAAGAAAENAQNLSQQQDANKFGLQQLTGNQQAGIEDLRQTGDTTRTAMTEAGANARNDASIAGNLDVAKIGKRSYQKDVNGALALLDGADVVPVNGPDGKAFTPQDPTEKLTLPDLFQGYNDQVKAINASYQPPEVKQAQLDQLNANPIYAPLLAKTGAKPTGTPAAKVPAGAQTATNPKTGEKMFLNPASGQWEPVL